MNGNSTPHRRGQRAGAGSGWSQRVEAGVDKRRNSPGRWDGERGAAFGAPEVTVSVRPR